MTTPNLTPNPTRKIVINACFGGFGLSHEAMMRYAEIKGITLHAKKTGFFGDYMYATIPWDEMPQEPESWGEASEEERKAYCEAHEKHYINDRDIPRDDAALVQTVEELSEEASDVCAGLKVVEIPADVKWVVAEYDGNEWIAEEHRTWG